MKYIIVARSKGLEDRYFVSCETQGEQLISWAYSMAKQFENRKKAKNKIEQIKEKFPSVDQWRCERYITPEQSQWEMDL